MASTYSTNLKIELQATGENSGTWGTITNTNLGTALEQAIVGYGNPNYASDANLTLTYTDTNAAQAARALVLNVTSGVSLTGTRELVVPTIQKQYIVQNNTTGSQSITVKTSAGTGITVPNGRKAHLYVDGTNVIYMDDYVDINGGSIDGTTIGANSAAAGNFTTVDATNLEVTNLKAKDGTAAGSIADSTGVVTLGSSVLTTTDINGGTIDGTTIGANSAAAGTFTSATVTTGNLTFSSTAQRITGDMSNATVSNRLAFQNSTTNGNTSVYALPNGTATAAQYVIVNNSDPTNASTAQLFINNTETRLISTITGTGTYLPMTFVTGGSERMRLDTSGLLGLGNTVASTINAANGVGNLVVGSGSGSEGITIYTGTADTGGIAFADGTTTTDTYRGYINYAHATDQMAFWTSASEKMRIDSSGNVGIGTTSPSTNLDVGGGSGAVSVRINGGASGTGNGANIYFSNNGAVAGTLGNPSVPYNTAFDNSIALTGYYGLRFDTTGTERMRIDSSGNVGIGTASPATKTEIYGTAAANNIALRVTNTATDGYSTVQLGDGNASIFRNGSTQSGYAGVNSLNLITVSTHPIGFSTNNSLRAIIDSSGNVGIGIASPGCKLDVYNSAAAAANNEVLRLRYNTAVTPGTSGDLNFANNVGTAIGRISSIVEDGNNVGLGFSTFNSSLSQKVLISANGNVGIGGTAGANEKLTLTGTLPTSSNTSKAISVQATSPSGSTSDCYVFESYPATQAAAFTLGSLQHFRAVGVTIGASSVITNQYGFLVSSNLTGATNNFGFYSNIASGSNRYNFYANGTAQNYFAGDTGVGATPIASTRLSVKGANQTAGNYTFRVRDGSDNDLFFVENNGLILTGTQAGSPYNNTTGNAANMYVENNGVLYRSTSSLRYKTDVTNAAHGLADVLKLRSVTYKGKNDGDKVFGGLIAEEVHDAGLTEFVAYDKEGRPDALHYGNMVALLVKAVQELSAKVAALEAK